MVFHGSLVALWVRLTARKANHQMATSSDTSGVAPVFHLPVDLCFECRRDGDCCRNWDIPVEPDEVERILTADWRSCSALGPDDDSPFLYPRKGKGGHVVIKRIDEACCFLAEDGLCRLHKRYGAEAKARSCQRYPFRFVEAPDGVYVGLSFGCRSVLRNTGLPVEKQFDRVREEFLRRPSYHRLAEPVRFDAATPIEWADYLAIEQALDEILAREDYSVGQCLIAGHAWLGILRQALLAGRKSPEQTPSRWVSFYVDSTRRDGFARAFQIARHPVAGRAVKRMLLGSFISFRSASIRRLPRLVVIVRLLLENARHWLRLGNLRLPPFQTALSYRDFRPGSADLDSREFQDILRRYFRHALFRKDLICHTDVFWGYCFLVLTYGLIQWYAAGLRAAGTPAPGSGGKALAENSASDGFEAVSIVERYYVHHSNFNQLFLYHPALAETIQYLFKRPNFAHSIVAG